MADRPAATMCPLPLSTPLPPPQPAGPQWGQRARLRAGLGKVLRLAGVLTLTGAALVLTGAALAEPGAGDGRQDDPLVARVNGHEMRLSEVYASIESLSLGDQIDARDQLETYIEALINEEVLFQWARRTDFGDAGELRKEVKELVVRHLIEQHVRSRLKVTDADAKAYYDANPSLVRGEHVRVRRILLPERPRCEALAREIGSEADFIEAARKNSLDDETRESGGDVGLMMRGESPPETYELEFFDMQQGEMRVFDVPQGCMLVRSVFYVNPPLPPFAAVRDQIRQYLRNKQEVALVDKLFREAGKGGKVERFYPAGGRVASPRAGGVGGASGTSR